MTILDTRRFLRQKILESNPDIEVRSGSAVGTLLLKPLSVLTNPTREEIEFIKTQLSLSDVSSLSTENVDQLITNLFIERRVGNISSGSVRLFFAESQSTLVPQGTGFLDRSGRLFLSSEQISISQAEMSLNRSGSQYYMDVPVTASSTGSEYNIEANEIVSTDTTINGVIRVTNPNPFTSGLDTETDEEFVDRAGNAITVRNLINRRSITTVLLNEYNFISSIQSIGFGDPEMIRDLINVNLSTGVSPLHIGGHGDIYIESTDLSSVYTDIPDTAMSDDLIISTNSDRGLVSSSVVPGLFVDIKSGFFGEFELKQQDALSLDPNSTYYIYLDVAGILQLDKIGGSFPANGIPLAIVVTDAFNVTSVTDSREDVIEFARPMIYVDSIVELDPLTGEETERELSDGREQLSNETLSTDTVEDPEEFDSCISPDGDVYVSFVRNGDVYLCAYSDTGDLILSPVNASDPSGTFASVSRNPKIFYDPLAKINIVFEDDRSGQYDIYHTRLDLAGSVEVAVNNPGGATSGVDSLNTDSDETGNMHLTWLEGNSLLYQKIDRDGTVLVSVATVSSTSNSKLSPDISTNGNTIVSASTGSANGTTTFEDTTTDFVSSGVLSGQTIVLTGGDIEYSAIMDGSESEPPAFSAVITGDVSNSVMDTSVASGYNTLTVAIDGVSVAVTFTDTPVNPIATVISEINSASNATALSSSIASNSGSDEVVITSPTTGISSTVNITSGNEGIGLAAGDSDQGGTGYDTSIANGTNSLSVNIDGTDYNVVFTDTQGNPLSTVVSEINAAVGSSVASDGGGVVRITSTSTGIDSYIEINNSNSSLGFSAGQREEGGTEIGKRIGISAVVDADTLTLSEVVRTVSVAPNIEYRIESIEATICWGEDYDVFVSKLDDAASVLIAPFNLTREEVQSSQLATPLTDALYNGPGSNEVTLDDTSALFLSNSVSVGDIVRVTSATPASAQGDYTVKQINSETELILNGSLASSPANSVTYEIFKPDTSTLPNIGSTLNNENVIVWSDNNRTISKITINQIGGIVSDDRDIISSPEYISSLDIFVDPSNGTSVSWVQNASNRGHVYYARIDKLNHVSIEANPISSDDIISSGVDVQVNSEYEPITLWLATDNSSIPTKRNMRYHRSSAQDYYIKVNNPSINMSNVEDRSVVFTNEFIFQPVRIKYQTSDGVSTVHDYITGSQQQIIDSNYLVKHTELAMVYADIKFSGTVSSAQQVVIDYINSVDEQNLQTSDISDALYEAGATYVELPFTITVKYYDINGKYNESSSENELFISRLARYTANTSTVNVTNIG